MAAETVLVALFSTYYLGLLAPSSSIYSSDLSSCAGLGFWVSIDTQNVIARSDHICFLWTASFTGEGIQRATSLG